MNRKLIYFSGILLLVTIVFFRGYHVFNTPIKDALSGEAGKIISIEGRVDTRPLVKDFTKTFVLKTNEGSYVRVNTDRFSEYKYGDTVKATGKLSLPRNFEGNGGRVFDYVNYLAKDDIYHEFKKANVIVIDEGRLTLSRILFDIKDRFLENISLVLGEPHAALAGGLVVGEKSALGKELTEDFRRAGLIHIVVLSGYNITIIATMMRKVLSFLPRSSGIVIGIISIIIFGILVGGGATVIRSCIMAVIALSGELLRKDYAVTRALFIAALVMLIHNPLILLYDPSFQLSFLATFGLIVLAGPLEKIFSFVTEKFGMRSVVASTLAAQIFVSPLILYMMGDLSIVGIFVNVIVLPFIPLTMLFVFLAGMLGFFSRYASQFAGWISHILLSYELLVVRVSARLPFAIISLPAFSIRIVWGVYVIYYAFFLWTRLLGKNSSEQLPNSD